MSAINKFSLAADEAARIDHLEEDWSNSGKLALEKLFRFSSVVSALKAEKVFLPGSRTDELLGAFPFHDRVFHHFCSGCEYNDRVITPLLETGQVIPVLLGSYKHYKASILKKILRYPHISHDEFHLFRLAYYNGRPMLCSECLGKRIHKAASKGSIQDSHSISQLVTTFCQNLSPYPDLDSEIVDAFCSAARANNLDKMQRLEEVSFILRQLRTAEIFGASPSLEAKDFENCRQLGIELSEENKKTLPLIETILAEGLEIAIPTGMPPEKYIEIVLPHKEKLARIARLIAENSRRQTDGKISLSALISEIGSINEQIRRAYKTRRFAALQASAGLISTSPVLIGTLLAGGAAGLCSSMFGCHPGVAASLAGGAGAIPGAATLLSKVLKPKRDVRVTAYKKRVLSDLREQLSGFMGMYLNMEIQALHVWQLRKDLGTNRASK